MPAGSAIVTTGAGIAPEIGLAAAPGALRRVRKQERAMSVGLLGPGLVVLFAVSQAFRDVYFAGVFQGVNFFAIILLAFSISAVVFGAMTLIRDPASFARLRTNWWALVWMNLTTALAWTCYFFSLKHLQPSIVITLHSGIGPLTVLAAATLGVPIAKSSRVSSAEYVCYAGLAASLAFLWWVVLAGHSGLAAETWRTSLASLALLLVSGASITISLLLSKRLSDRGIGADAITAGRYILIIAIALAVVLAGERPTGIGSWHELAILLMATTVLIVLPLYALQVGIGRTAPLTAHVVRSLGPVFTFALELVDGRIAYAALPLAGILSYSLFSVAGNLARGWGEDSARSVAPLGASHARHR
jgi:drug/metabolite transporter (DMT)-like permease